MKRILIFGNSGSGKTTLAKSLVDRYSVAHLDLDTIAWQATQPPLRRSLKESLSDIDSFCRDHDSWVIEGCYTDLLELVSHHANEAIFMNLSVEQCRENAQARAWEPHKYDSKEAQDQNLAMLLDWISGYETRSDTFSRQAHEVFYDKFNNTKTQVTSNLQST